MQFSYLDWDRYRLGSARAEVVLEDGSARLSDEVGPTEANRQVRPAFVVDLLRRNLVGRAVSTGVAGQLEADRRLARGFVSLPQLFGRPVTTNLFLTASREDFTPEGSTPFVEDRSDITVEQRFGTRSLEPRGRTGAADRRDGGAAAPPP